MESKTNYLENQIIWLSSLINQNGEFIINNNTSDGKYSITPYFSNISCLALLENNYIEKVKSYLYWYISHLNYPDRFGINGSMYDYYVSNGVLISKNDYDSLDSYGSTFLTLCYKYYLKSKDYSFFFNNKPKINNILSSVISSFDNDNLTFAKPNYKYKYLMDNCEVYRGIYDASLIYKDIYNDFEKYNNLKQLSQKIFDSIENKLWSNSNSNYYPYINNLGFKPSPDMKKWYPDASCQLFPVLYELYLPESQRSKDLYNTFNVNYPNWFNEGFPDFPNVFVGYVSLLMKDYYKVQSFLNICHKYIENNCQWPWYNLESSYYIRIAASFRN